MPRSTRKTKRGARAAQVGPLERAMELLHAFVDGQEEWGVRELAAATGEPTSTTQRLLARLREMGLLEFDEERRRYRAGFELYRMSAVLGQRDRVRQTAGPVMEELVATLKEDVWLATYDAARRRIAYVAQRSAPATLRFPLPLGHEEPARSEPSGWAVLGLLGEAQLTDGYCAGPSAFSADVVIVAAPIVDAAGRPCASLCVLVPRHRFKDEDARRYGIAVRDAAHRVSRLLGATLLGGAGAGSWHDAVSVIAGLLQRKSSNVSVVPARGGGQQNLEDLQHGRAAYCLTTTVSLADAFHGRDGFPQKHDRLRGVMNLSALYLQVFVRRGVRVKTLQDLARLRVSPGAEGFSSAQLFHSLMAFADVATRKRGEVLHFDYREGARQLSAGSLDAVFWLTSLDNAVCLELAASNSADLLQLPQAPLAKFAAGSGYRLVRMMPARAPAVRTLEVATALATTSDRPDDEVYRVARVIHENRHEFALQEPVGSVASMIGPCSADMPSHSGAARFWDEVTARSARAA